MSFTAFNPHNPTDPFGVGEGPPQERGQPIEELFPQPTNPNRGPYIGRSSLIEKGQTVSVIEVNQCNLGEMLTFCLTQNDYPEVGEDPRDIKTRLSLTGHILWRVGQHQDFCDVDWVRGTLLTIPAGNVTINCSYPTSSVPGVLQPRQIVGALTAPLIRPGGLGIRPLARLTTVLDTLPAVVEVPRRAQAVSLLLINPALYTTVSITQRYTAGLGAGADAISAFIPTDDREWVLANGCRSVAVSAAASGGALVWSIAL